MTVRVLIGSTVPPYKEDIIKWCTSWLETDLRGGDHEVDYICALELDGRGHTIHMELLSRLAELGGVRHEFRFDDGADYLTNEDRLDRICLGRNIVMQHGQRRGYDAILFLDSDVWVPPDTLTRMLQVEWPIVGGLVPTYCLTGNVVQTYGQLYLEAGWALDRMNAEGRPRHEVIPSTEAMVHWNTAGFLLMRRPLFRHIRWLWDVDEGLTDDPATQFACVDRGYPTLVLHDLVGEHRPPAIGPLASRGHDLRIHR